jgi:hypothetical protein
VSDISEVSDTSGLCCFIHHFMLDKVSRPQPPTHKISTISAPPVQPEAQPVDLAAMAAACEGKASPKRRADIERLLERMATLGQTERTEEGRWEASSSKWKDQSSK